MKKIIGFIFCCLFAIIASGQEEGTYHPATARWIENCPTYPISKTIVAINLFICASNNDGNFAKMDRCWVFGINTEANAKVSIVNPTSTAITNVNSCTFSSYAGYSVGSSNTTQYLNTGFTLSTQGVNYTKNSAGVAFYARNNVGTNGYSGEYDLTNYAGIQYGTGSGTTFAFENDNGSATGVSSSYNQLCDARRINSTTLQLWRNGSQIGSNITVSSGAIPVGLTFWIFGSNRNGTLAASEVSRNYAYFRISSGIVSAASENTDITTILKPYLGW